MQKKWLYFLIIVCPVAGSLWVMWNRVYYVPSDPNSGLNMCLFRRITGLPCPSCGTTRSVLDLSRLDFKDALFANPIGFIIAFGMIVFPFWVVYDIVNRRNTFYTFYHTVESVIKKKWVAISLIFVIAINWLWTIFKFT